MDQDELATQAQIVREISASMFTDAVEIMSFLDVLETGNDKALRDNINKAGAGRAFGHVERALYTRLHFLVARAYFEKTRPGDLHAQRAFDIIKDKAIRQ